VFTNTNVTINRPDGEKIVANVITVSSFLVLDPLSGNLKGKKIQSMFQTQIAPVSKLMTWAWGVPGGNGPKSYQSAMVEENNAEFVFASCNNQAKNICNFDH